MKHVKLFEELNSADQFVTTKLIGNSDVDKYLPIGTILTSFSLEDEKDYSEIPYRAKNQKHYWVTKKKGHSIANQFGLRDDKAQMHIFIGPSLFDDNEIIVCLVDAEENDISMYDESLKTVKGAIRRFADDVGLTKLTQESTMIKNYEDFLNEAKKTEKFIDNIFLKKVKAKFDSLTKGMKEGDAAVSSGISGDMLFLEWCPDMASDYENQEAYRAAGCTAFNDPNQPYDDLELNYYQFVPKIIESLGGRLVVKLDGKLQDSKKGKPILFGTHWPTEHDSPTGLGYLLVVRDSIEDITISKGFGIGKECLTAAEFERAVELIMRIQDNYEEETVVEQLEAILPGSGRLASQYGL